MVRLFLGRKNVNHRSPLRLEHLNYRMPSGNLRSPRYMAEAMKVRVGLKVLHAVFAWAAGAEAQPEPKRAPDLNQEVAPDYGHAHLMHIGGRSVTGRHGHLDSAGRAEQVDWKSLGAY